MFTVFHLFALIATIIGLICGVYIGVKNFSWLNIVVFGLCGTVIGYIVGNIPFLLGLYYLRRNLRKCDTTKLKQRLEKETYISHLILAELNVRKKAENDKLLEK